MSQTGVTAARQRPFALVACAAASAPSSHLPCAEVLLEHVLHAARPLTSSWSAGAIRTRPVAHAPLSPTREEASAAPTTPNRTNHSSSSFNSGHSSSSNTSSSRSTTNSSSSSSQTPQVTSIARRLLLLRPSPLPATSSQLLLLPPRTRLLHTSTRHASPTNTHTWPPSVAPLLPQLRLPHAAIRAATPPRPMPPWAAHLSSAATEPPPAAAAAAAAAADASAPTVVSAVDEAASAEAAAELLSLSGRDVVEYDVVVVGAGPSGLAAAIRLKQLKPNMSVCVVEKGAQAGAHILSGNVFEPRALTELLPGWKEEGAPLFTPVSLDRFSFLTSRMALPLPPPESNKGNYVISLSELVQWLAQRAEDMGVEIYPGFAAAKLLYSSTHSFHSPRRVCGVVTNDVGVAKDGSRKDTYQPGMAIKGRLTLLAEGCRGSLSEEAIASFSLRERAGAQQQTYALGVKEVWEVPPSHHSPGSVLHTVGYPLTQDTYGGGFLYHMHDNMVALGLVVALDYRNPYLSPYQEFQRWKLHPSIRSVLEGGRVLQYGARALNEGGVQSLPSVVFPGGALIGCAAGFLNVPKIKGSHTAIKSGMLAAEAAAAALSSSSSSSSTTTPSSSSVDASMSSAYPTALRASWLWEELYRARNIRPGFKYGLVPGLINAAFETYISRGLSPWTLQHHSKRDNETLTEISTTRPIDYPKPDGKITFDIPTSLYRSSTNHEHDQPPHLLLRDPSVPVAVNLDKYGGPEGRYCPAKVYEYVQDDRGDMALTINAQNCLHCKACDIKDPTLNIQWTVPEGGGGPGYTVM